MSGDALRRAATRLRETAEPMASGEPWRDGRGSVRKGNAEIASLMGNLASAYIAMMRPGVGLALADCLDRLHEDIGEEFMNLDHPAVVLARLILGEPS